MIVLSKELYEEVWTLVEQSQHEYEGTNLENVTSLLERAWNLLPEPKVECEESFLISRWYIKTAIKFSDAELMRKWAEIIMIADLGRFDSGEREGWYGRVAYELGNYEIARKFLCMALKKSKGRCFDKNDKKYLDFIKLNTT